MEYKYVLLKQYFEGRSTPITKYVYKIPSEAYKENALVADDTYVGKIIKEVKPDTSKITYVNTYVVSKETAKEKLKENYIKGNETSYMSSGVYYIPNMGWDYISDEVASDINDMRAEALEEDANKYSEEILNELLKEEEYGL